MQTKISKTLEGLIARTAFDTSKQGETRWLKDRLLLEIVREEGSLAYQLLSARLKDWELYQVRLRIERDLQERTDGPAGNPEEFYVQFANELRKRYRTAPSVSTAHALHAIISDEQTIGAHVLEMYHITPAVVEDEIRRMSAADEPRAELHVRLLDYSEQGQRPAEGSRMLDKFGVDLTRQAREGKIDPVIGRECEIERVVQILSRRKKNNPILIGEAGVGKSAIVEGLALRIAAGDVPYTIAGKRLYSLDVSSLVAGTKFRGEFEERMQQLLDELRKADDTIIFIDEIHTIVGAGSTQGSLDTANILKPALARGELQTIGATTLDEYRENIEKDSALERRFQRVLVEPTSCEETLQILRNIAPRYEAHHKVRYTDEALEACVTLTNRYITDRFFPDKAIDVLDEAGSRMHLQTAREPDTLREMEAALASTCEERREAVRQLVYEKAAAARLRELALRSKLDESRAEWQRSLESHPAEIRAEHIAQVITSATGIPIERITTGELGRLRGLKDYLAGRVIGQDAAVEKVALSIQRSRAGLKDENRPIGVFLFVGPTGVGKTLLAKELSKWLFDERRGLIRIDMSEYGEKHNVSRLIGSPPGYVGYGEGGQLTESGTPPALRGGAVRRDREGASRSFQRHAPNLRRRTPYRRIGPQGRFPQHGHHHDLERRFARRRAASRTGGLLHLVEDGRRTGRTADRVPQGARTHLRAGVPQPHRRHHRLPHAHARRRGTHRRAGIAPPAGPHATAGLQGGDLGRGETPAGGHGLRGALRRAVAQTDVARQCRGTALDAHHRRPRQRRRQSKDSPRKGGRYAQSGITPPADDVYAPKCFRVSGRFFTSLPAAFRCA